MSEAEVEILKKWLERETFEPGHHLVAQIASLIFTRIFERYDCCDSMCDSMTWHIKDEELRSTISDARILEDAHRLLEGIAKTQLRNESRPKEF